MYTNGHKYGTITKYKKIKYCHVTFLCFNIIGSHYTKFHATKNAKHGVKIITQDRINKNIIQTPTHL